MKITTKDGPSFISALYNTYLENKKSKKHWFKRGVLATVTYNGKPQIRTVVLRGLNQKMGIEVHTDARSAKVLDIQKNNQVSLLCYDGNSEVQLQFIGTAQVVQDKTVLQRAWEKVPLASRAQYTTKLAPGTPIATNSKIEQQEHPNFCILQIETHTIDYLKIGAKGRYRCQINNTHTPATLEQLVP